MKILMINKFLYPNGGSETYLFRLGAHLESCGHEVEYFGMEHEKRVVGNSLDVYTSYMDFHNASIFDKWAWPLKTIYSVEARKKMRRVLEQFEPDVIHLNNFHYQLTPSILLEAAQWRKQTHHNCTIVATAHDYQLVCPNHMLFNPGSGCVCERCLGGHFWNCVRGKCIHGSFAKSLLGAVEGFFWKWNGVYQQIDAIICCSEFIKAKLDSNVLFAKKTVLLRNFTDRLSDRKADGEALIACENEKKVSAGRYVLYFGRYSAEKGIDTLLRVCKKLPQISFVFAGSGPLERKLENIPNVQNVGFLEQKELKQLIDGSAFSVYPSEWYENAPLSVIESLVERTPVLGADIGGIPELIRNGENGELFESGNEEDLKHKIERLWQDPAKIACYRKNCESLSFPSIEEYYDQLILIYQRKLANETE